MFILHEARPASFLPIGPGLCLFSQVSRPHTELDSELQTPTSRNALKCGKAKKPQARVGPEGEAGHAASPWATAWPFSLSRSLTGDRFPVNYKIGCSALFMLFGKTASQRASCESVVTSCWCTARFPRSLGNYCHLCVFVAI